MGCTSNTSAPRSSTEHGFVEPYNNNQSGNLVYEAKENEFHNLQRAFADQNFLEIHTIFKGYISAGSISFINELLYYNPGLSIRVADVMIYFGDVKGFNVILKSSATYEQDVQAKKQIQLYASAWNECGQLFVDAKKVYEQTRDIRNIDSYLKSCRGIKRAF